METLFSIIAAQHPEMLSVRDIGKDLSFSSATIWAIDGAKRVHQIVGSGSPVIENQRDQSSCLPRRLDHQGRQSRTLFSASSRDHTSSTIIGVDNKLEEIPSRTLTCTGIKYLGLHFNLEQALISSPSSILETLINVMSRLSTSTMSARKITSINSRISHFAPFIHHGRLQLCFLPFWIKQHWSQHAQPWDSQIQLNKEYISHLHWFYRPEVLQGLPLHTPEPNLFFFTDASLTGWGSSWQDQQIM